MPISAGELEEIARRAAWHVWNYQHDEKSEPMYKLQELIRIEVAKVLETMPNVIATVMYLDDDIEVTANILRDELSSEQLAKLKDAL